MKIRNGFVLKDVLDTQPGELICFELEHRRAWGVILRRADDHLLIGVLSADGLPDRGSFAIRWSYPSACASFGNDWELEPVLGPEAFPNNDGTFDNVPGVLNPAAEGLLIRFGPAPQGNPRSGFHWNLEKNEVGRPVPGDEVPVARWRIWANAASPRHAGEAPLLEFTATPPKPA